MKEDKKPHLYKQNNPPKNDKLAVEKAEFKNPYADLFWIQTYSSNKFDFGDNTGNRINIHDIAHPLSQIVRFSEHLKYPLSVAQHSLTVMAVMRYDGYTGSVLLEALMHDCHEAFVGDISTPLKNYLSVNYGFNLRKFEMEIRDELYARFGVKNENPDLIKKYDLICCKTEANSLFDKIVDDWTDSIPYKLQNGVKEILEPRMAKELFISKFKQLGGKL